MRILSSPSQVALTPSVEAMDMTTPPPTIVDPALPAVEEMLGEGALGMVAAALGDTGPEVRTARPVHVTWRPGRGIEVRYLVEVSGEQGDTTLDLVAAAGRSFPEGTTLLQLDGDEKPIGIWPVEGDPFLPGLKAALSPDAVRTLLGQVGVPSAGVHLRLIAYRPGRRAVVEVRTGALRLFLKVVRPRAAEALQQRHREMVDRIPSPASHGWSEEYGIVVLGELPGQSLREALTEGRPVPGAEALRDLLHSIPEVGDGTPARSALDTALGHVPLLKAVSPQDAALIDSLAGVLEPLPRGEAEFPIHGDFHAAQVMVDASGAISGLLDLDTAGMGARVADWATMVGHLDASIALLPRHRRARVRKYVASLIAEAEREVDADLLAGHVAGVVLGLATGPFRVQMAGWPEETRRRLELSAAWARRAGLAVPES